MPRILIVEDSPTMRALLSSALEDLEGSVKLVEAESGFEALRLLPRERWDLIVTDVNMPDINGLELVSLVKGSPAYTNVPLVIVSTEARTATEKLPASARIILVKPVEPRERARSCRHLLARAGAKGLHGWSATAARPRSDRSSSRGGEILEASARLADVGEPTSRPRILRTCEPAVPLGSLAAALGGHFPLRPDKDLAHRWRTSCYGLAWAAPRGFVSDGYSMKRRHLAALLERVGDRGLSSFGRPSPAVRRTPMCANARGRKRSAGAPPFDARARALTSTEHLLLSRSARAHRVVDSTSRSQLEECLSELTGQPRARRVLSTLPAPAMLPSRRSTSRCWWRPTWRRRPAGRALLPSLVRAVLAAAPPPRRSCDSASPAASGAPPPRSTLPTATRSRLGRRSDRCARSATPCAVEVRNLETD